MSCLRIHRTDQISQPIDCEKERIFYSEELLENIRSTLQVFLQEQKLLQEQLNFSLSGICEHPRNKQLFAFLDSRFHLPLSEEQMMTIMKVVAFVKKQSFFSLGQINRFKIEGLCSFSVLSQSFEPSLDDALFIHFKKKTSATVMGKGARSKAFKALQFTKGCFSWVAEKTNYSSVVKNYNSSQLAVDPLLFLNPPWFSYNYYQDKTKDETCNIVKKHCSLEKLYDMSLIEIIEANETTRFLSEKKTWEVARSLIGIIKELHGKNLIYRDLKPDNILVSLENTSGCFSLNKFSIVAGDLETVTSEGVEEDKWYGSSLYFPKDRSKEKQRKPYDIYALGKILEVLFFNNFESKMYTIHLHSIISRMKDEDFEKRPPIQEVESIFTSLYPRYLDLVNENPDCLSVSDCAIL